MMRESMSRPAPTVPRTWRHEPPVSQTGGAFTASRNCSIGEWGAIIPANSAVVTTIATMERPKTAPLFSRKAAQKAAQGLGAARIAMAGSPGASAASVKLALRPMSRSASMPDPRVDRAIEEIDQHIDHDDDEGDQHHPALQRGIVAPSYRFDQPFADAGP